VAAGLERDVHGRALEVGVAGVGDRRDLGVRAADHRVPPLPHDVAVPDHHGTDERIGRNVTPTALCELDRALEVQVVGIGGR